MGILNDCVLDQIVRYLKPKKKNHSAGERVWENILFFSPNTSIGKTLLNGSRICLIRANYDVSTVNWQIAQK